jgi:AcrR family transcriptional regulator
MFNSFLLWLSTGGIFMARRSDHNRDELRSMALNAAQEIIMREGAQNLTTRKVAAKMGYSPGTLYLIFKNLDDLKLTANVQNVLALRSRLLAATVGIDGPVERLKAMAHCYLEFGLTGPNLWRLMFEHQMPGNDSLPEDMTNETDGLLQILLDEFRQLLPNVEQGEVLRVATAYWSALHGVTHLVITNKLQLAHTGSAHSVLDTQLDLLFRGLASK